MDDRGANERRFYVGVDGGGTKTYAVVTDEAFRVVGEGRAGASNFLRTGLEPAALAVERAVCLACLEAGVRLRDVRVAGIGLAGVDHRQHYASMYRTLRARFPFRTLALMTDARAAVAGATDLAPGVVVVAGTGSVAIGVDKDGRTAQSGGWGPIMGDEGSGHDIARHALAAVAGSIDGRLPHTTLIERVCQRFGVATAEDLLPVIYDPLRTSKLDFTDLAKTVVEEAANGDGVAREILVDAGRELAAIVVAVIRRLGLEQTAFRVAYVGGVFAAGDLILAPLADEVRCVAPRAEFAAPLFGPAVGAAKLAAAGYKAGGESIRRGRGGRTVAPAPGSR